MTTVPLDETTITPPTGMISLQLDELWRHRDLLRYLSVRDIAMAYANTKIGIFWVLLQPLAFAIVLTLVMGILIRIPTGGVPYPLIIMTGFPFWIYFSGVVTRSANSMGANAHLLTKVYFPRAIIVLVPVATGLVDLFVLVGVVLLSAPFFGIWPSWPWLLLPIPIVMTVMLSLGVGLGLSLLTVHSRDIGLALPVALQVGMYLCPIIYPIGLVPTGWRWLYDLNPMVGIIELSRWAVLDAGEFPVYSLTASLISIVLILICGVVFFRVMEDATTDLV
jgi:lipopolysaccharide transport system permease protein